MARGGKREGAGRPAGAYGEGRTAPKESRTCSIRMGLDEYSRIQEKASESGLSFSAYMIKKALE